MSTFDWSPGGCCCKALYDAWAILTSGRVAVRNLVQKVGEPSNSLGEFDFASSGSGNYLLSMARGSHVFVVRRNSGDTAINVACYDVNTGNALWDHSLTTSSSATTGYLVYGGGSGQYALINEDQLFLTLGGGREFSTGGVTSYSNVVVTTTDPYQGNSARWIPQDFSSHDYPIRSGIRIKYLNPTITYVNTTGFGPYNHNYTLDYDVEYEVGFGAYNHATGTIDAVTSADTHAAPSVTGQSDSITNASPTPPASPSLSDFSNGNNVSLGLSQVIYFSSIGGNYALSWMPIYGGTRYERVVMGGNLVDSWTYAHAGGTNTYTLSLAVIHDSPPDPDYARIIYSYGEPSAGPYYIAGHELDGTQMWQQEVVDEFTRVLSVNDTWAMVYSPISKSTELAPDGRDWGNVTGLTELEYWMVKLDNSEWEPIRIESTATSWSQHSILTSNTQQIDLVKTVTHPASPPADSYNSTPP